MSRGLGDVYKRQPVPMRRILGLGIAAGILRVGRGGFVYCLRLAIQESSFLLLSSSQSLKVS